MRQKAIILAAVCAYLLPGHTAHADAKADARKGIQAAYDRYADAVAHGDVNTIMSIKPSGYSNIDMDGNMTQRSEQEAREHWKRFTAPPNKVLSTYRILSLEIHGNEATVTDEEHVGGVRLDNNTGVIVPIHVVESDRDFWVKGGGRWIWKRSRTLSVTGG